MRRALSTVPRTERAASPPVGAIKSWQGFGVRMSREEIEAHVGRLTAPVREIRNVTPPPRRFEPDPPATELGARQIAAQMRAATIEGDEFLVAVGPFRATGRDVAIVVAVTVLMLVLS